MDMKPRCSMAGCLKIPVVEVGPGHQRFCHEHQLKWERLCRPWFGKIPTNILTKPGKSTEGGSR